MPSSHALLLPTELNPATDASTTAAVRMLFSQHQELISQAVDVATREGIVQLTGFADTPQIRQRAAELALSVSGVRGLNNLLLCTDEARKPRSRGGHLSQHKRRSTPGSHCLSSDETLTTQIWKLLEYDSGINSGQVQIRTASQVVTLTGTVATAAEKARLIATAYQAGASRVVSHDLQVAYWFAYRPDDYLAQLVRDALHASPQLPATEPLVQVQDGIVTLAGVVATLHSRQVAEQIAQGVQGVRQVRNLLKVRARQSAPDDTIRRSVADALARNVHVGRFFFRVSVRFGKVHLSGVVDTAFEQREAEHVAAGIEGVVAVENEVEVRGYPGAGSLPPFSLGTTPAFLPAETRKRPPFQPSLPSAASAVGHFLLT
ncbi:Osmotically-inducible protein OsmY, contains BON domain [Hymenobacter gelipurpurascens]|uniref:Osmotically-inducible protein OsmY, contains BON domain n=1 Tax=Hymenobacter gelipurpurascens TaxID=89968 RepID=A0A212TKM3_9BACT|nr:BON domain-containing protein [Hymenobacter gelipurpurascens]SNC66523.1 Osmotically-inducible protein OsmY, contains BON domain [Hymenobacter gelipurpurascens]